MLRVLVAGALVQAAAAACVTLGAAAMLVELLVASCCVFVSAVVLTTAASTRDRVMGAFVGVSTMLWWAVLLGIFAWLSGRPELRPLVLACWAVAFTCALVSIAVGFIGSKDAQTGTAKAFAYAFCAPVSVVAGIYYL